MSKRDGDEEGSAAKRPRMEEAPAPAPAPAEGVVDVEQLLEIVDGDVDFALELVGEALGEFASHVATLKSESDAAEGDWLVKVKVGAHSIKGVASNLALTKLHKRSAALEKWAGEKSGEGLGGDKAVQTEAQAAVAEVSDLVDEVKALNPTLRAKIEAHTKASS
mmetsp:Transcript_9234/g.27638  ORF Transcript_9234/g.27638 Transcript_9234/m.27638 type:complete len:164 (-) Transcript_9234:70-561(-)